MRYTNTNKTENIQLSKDNYYVVLDFDGTITNAESIDSWMALIDFEIYGEECKKDVEKLNGKYKPIESDYEMEYEIKKQHLADWYGKSMNLLYKYQLTYTKLQKALQKEKLKLREGAKEFLKKLHQEDIPVIIISAGIGNTIEEFLKKQECYYNNIYIISNFIKFKENKMQKFTGTIIHSMNKKMEGFLPERWQNEIKQKEYAILCGDIVDDIQMTKKENLDKTVTIGFLNNNTDEKLKCYNQNYDFVLTEEEACFQEVEKIMLQFTT